MVDTFVMLLAPLGNMITLMKSGQAEHAHVLLGRDSVQEGWKRKVFALDAKHDEGIEGFVSDGILAHRDSLA